MKRVVTIESENLQATHQIGRHLGAALSTGDVIALIGPLGSGKTTLVKGLADGAGVADLRQVNSPTFVIVNEYNAHAGKEPLRIHHIDVYRLGGSDDLEAIGFDEMCDTGAVVVEWADRVIDLLPEDRLTVVIEPTGTDQRHFQCTAGGHRAGQLLAAVEGGPSPGEPDKAPLT